MPRPTPYVHAREAFLYLISFIALYVSAISFGYLVFGLIDRAFPDALDFRDRYPSGGEATSIASVIVAFPLYLFLMKRLSTEVAVDPDKRLSLVRRWLTYLTLVNWGGHYPWRRHRAAGQSANGRADPPILFERRRHPPDNHLHIRVLHVGYETCRYLDCGR